MVVMEAGAVVVSSGSGLSTSVFTNYNGVGVSFLNFNKSCWNHVNLRLRGGWYTNRPMDKFIVFGGTTTTTHNNNNNNDATVDSIPPKEQQLHTTNIQPRGVPLTTPPENSSGVGRSFQRLRANSWTKKNNKYNVHDKVVKDASYESHNSQLGSELLVEHKRSGEDGINMTTVISEEASEMSLLRSREGMVLSETFGNHKVAQSSEYEMAARELPDSERIFYTAKASEDSSNGRNSAKFIEKLRSTKDKVAKKYPKSNVDSDFFSSTSFRDLGCTDHFDEFFRKQLLVRPSHIQAMSFAQLNKGESCILADQSGSGKTLAYLLPVIHRLRQEELQGISKSFSQNPRVVILVPTAELASQVLRNCRLMSKFGVPFRSMVATGGFRQRTQLENLRQDLDVLIATPGRFVYLVEEGFLQLTNLKCAVLDEVDILFSDEDFEPALRSLINSSPVSTQYVFVTATLPLDIYNRLVETFPDCKVIMGPGMHRTSSGLEEILVDCSGDEGAEKTPETAFLNKKSALLQLVEGSPVTKMIVFCNKIETCRKVENAIKRIDRKGFQSRVLPFHAALSLETRVANMEEFCRTQSNDTSLFLICTDRASRGIDFVGVDQVVLFDFPRDPSEYVRRVGRTARGAGGKGKAFIFVVGKQVSLARRIIERNRKGHPLHDVPSTYERIN